MYSRGRDDAKRRKVERICRDLAIAGWNDRGRYVERLAQIRTLETATAMAKALGEDASLPPLLFADIGDNPGGGARSNTTFVLKAFLDAGVTGAVFGHFYDIAAVQKCHEVRRCTARVTIRLRGRRRDLTPPNHAGRPASARRSG